MLPSGGGSLAVTKLLVEEGADLEQRNPMKETPLIRGAHNGEPKGRKLNGNIQSQAALAA